MAPNQVFVAATGYTSDINPDADDLERIARTADQRMIDADVFGMIRGDPNNNFFAPELPRDGAAIIGGLRNDTRPLQEDANALAQATKQFNSILGASPTETLVGIMPEGVFRREMNTSGVNILR